MAEVNNSDYGYSNRPITPVVRSGTKAIGPEEFKRYFVQRRRMAAKEAMRVERSSVGSVQSGLASSVRTATQKTTAAGHAADKTSSSGRTALQGNAPKISTPPTPRTERTQSNGQTVARQTYRPAAKVAPATSIQKVETRVAAVASTIGQKARKYELIDKSMKLAEEWIEIDSPERRAEGERKKIPFMTMVAILTVALSLLLIVAGSVIASKASRELSLKEAELEEKLQVRDELVLKLELKNDLRYIDEVARTKLGMIDREYAPVTFIGEKVEDKVEIYDDGNSMPSAIAALLSALGFIR